MRLPQHQGRILCFDPVLLTMHHGRVRSWLQGNLTRVWCQQFPVLDQVPAFALTAAQHYSFAKTHGVGSLLWLFSGFWFFPTLWLMSPAVCSVALDTL